MKAFLASINKIPSFFSSIKTSLKACIAVYAPALWPAQTCKGPENRYSNRSGSKCLGPTETELNIQKCGLEFSTSTKFDVWERLALVLRRCLSYSGFASLEKSLNFRGNP